MFLNDHRITTSERLEIVSAVPRMFRTLTCNVMTERLHMEVLHGESQ